jgi:hypothetical protein
MDAKLLFFLDVQFNPRKNEKVIFCMEFNQEITCFVIPGTHAMDNITICPVVVELPDSELFFYLDNINQLHEAITNQLIQLVRAAMGKPSPGMVVSQSLMDDPHLSEADIILIHYIKRYRFSTATVAIQVNEADEGIMSKLGDDRVTKKFLRDLPTDNIKNMGVSVIKDGNMLRLLSNDFHDGDAEVFKELVSC